MKVILAATVLIFYLFFNLSNAFHRDGSSRIVGGRDAPEGYAPYKVSLHFSVFGHFGGGAIISDRWVVTVAQCLYIIPIENVTLYVGSNKQSGGGQYYKPSLYIMHENYNHDKIHNDIGLIKTEVPFSFNANVQAIVLSRTRPADGVQLDQIGWGSILAGEEIQLPDNLQLLTVSHISLDKCAALSVDNPRFHESELCTQPQRSQGLCFGDSGSTLVYNNEVVGLASYLYNDTCGAGYPEYSVSIAYFYDWIQAKIQSQ